MDKKKVISFKTTNSVDFSMKFAWFSSWLSANAESIDIAQKKAVLKKKRGKELPKFPETKEAVIWNGELEPFCPRVSDIISYENIIYRCIKNCNGHTEEELFDEGVPSATYFQELTAVDIAEMLIPIWFLEDIRFIYIRGIAYECPLDFITSAEFSSSVSDIEVDNERHVLLLPMRNYTDFADGYSFVSKINQNKGQISVEHTELSDIRIRNIQRQYLNENGIGNGDKLSEALSKLNDSVVWVDMIDDPSVMTNNSGDRLMYNDGWYVLTD